VLSEQERTAGTPEQAEALLAATRDGDIDRALAWSKPAPIRTPHPLPRTAISARC
jgi:hypothetical protein